MARCSASNSSRRRHDLAVGQLRAVAVDDAARLLRVVGVDRDPDFAEAVDRQRKDVRGTSGRRRRDGMPCASSRPRTMLASTSDCVRKMTTRSSRTRARLITLFLDSSVVERLRRATVSTFSRIIVMSSCCGASPTNASTSRRTRSRSSSDGRSACSSSSLREPRLAEAVVGRVHRLADAVGEEDIQIARRAAESSPRRAAARTSRRCRASARAPGRPAPAPAPCRRPPVRAAGTYISGVWPARA